MGVLLGLSILKGGLASFLIALTLFILAVPVGVFALSSLRRGELKELRAAIDQLISRNLETRLAAYGPRDEFAGVIDSLNQALDIAVAGLISP